MSVHRTSSPTSSLARAGGITATIALLACSSGGDAGSGTAETAFSLNDIKYGRQVEEGGSEDVVSPLSTVETDPITGFVIPGTLAPLTPEVNLDRLISLGLGPGFGPRVVPRNGTLVLEFNREVDPTSLVADTLDSDGIVVEQGSISIQFNDDSGRAIPVTLSVPEGRETEVWITAVSDEQVGFPASPVDFGPDGEARADATGFLKLLVTELGPNVVRSEDGKNYTRREDRLGSPNVPIGLNPGNEVLDFIAQNELVPTNESFNGFLPDLSAPRMVREHSVEHIFDSAAGDDAGNTSLTIASANFSGRAQNGRGEWADKLLILRPGKKFEETQTIAGNNSTTLDLIRSFRRTPNDGDEIVLRRAEFFEPDPADPIDPELFDPNNPENGRNAQLVNFITAWELDANLQRVGEPMTLRDTLPAHSELVVHFNEPMDLRSFGQWENFMVSKNPDEGPGSEILTRLRANARGDEVSIQPVLVDQAAETEELIGWGKGQQSWRFTLTTVPTVSDLAKRMSSAEVQAFLNLGIRGIADLGGRPLAFPNSRFDESTIAISLTESFSTDEAIQSADPPLPVRDIGVAVHRFQGQPFTGTDPATEEPGVKYVDQENYYRPIADVNLQVNGRLAGQPVVFLTKVHDDFNPPPDGQFGAFPLGTASPLVPVFLTGEVPPIAHSGARLQQVWRDVDCSPALGLGGTLLDLYRLSWAPIGGNVTTDVYENISLHLSHSHVRPITRQNGAGASERDSGLNEWFDYATYEDDAIHRSNLCPATSNGEGPNYYPWDSMTAVPNGTRYTISQSQLFTPPFDKYPYHPWPAFETPFQYNNGAHPRNIKEAKSTFNKAIDENGGRKNMKWKDYRDSSFQNDGGDSLFFEVRIQPQATTVSGQNGFTFSPGILITFYPYFRVHSRGDSSAPLFPDDIVNDPRARCATATGPRPALLGDNSRYFAVFDYVKTTSRITSPYTPAFPATVESPSYLPAILQPPLAQSPPGTSVLVEYEGADDAAGQKGTGFEVDIRHANGKRHIAFRVTFVGNTETLLSPNFDLVAIPYDRE